MIEPGYFEGMPEIAEKLGATSAFIVLWGPDGILHGVKGGDISVEEIQAGLLKIYEALFQITPADLPEE